MPPNRPRRRALAAAFLAATLTACSITPPRSVAPTTQPPAASSPRPTASTPSSVIRPTGAVVQSDAQRAPDDPQARTRAAAALELLATELYAELVKDADDLVFSPYSVMTALAMTRLGARGQTAVQMDAVLNSTDPADLQRGMNSIELALAKRPGRYPYGMGGQTVELELATANQLWGQRGFAFERAFIDGLATYHGAGLRLVDYVNATEQARVEINDWVAERTKDRIPELIPRDVLDEATRFVLTNAIYLKAKWSTAFTEGATSPAPFHRLDGTRATVQMMSGSMGARYGAGAGYEAVRLGYVGGLSMALIVPEAGRFREFEASLATSGRLGGVIDQMTPEQVNLRLPKFEFRSPSKLRPALSALGMPVAFTDRADFAGISPPPPTLYIQDVVHEAFISVDEHGTEAAAATAVIGGATGGPPRIIELTVDRPFLFVILDDETGTILFMGRVLDPS